MKLKFRKTLSADIRHTAFFKLLLNVAHSWVTPLFKELFQLTFKPYCWIFRNWLQFFSELKSKKKNAVPRAVSVTAITSRDGLVVRKALKKISKGEKKRNLLSSGRLTQFWAKKQAILCRFTSQATASTNRAGKTLGRRTERAKQKETALFSNFETVNQIEVTTVCWILSALDVARNEQVHLGPHSSSGGSGLRARCWRCSTTLLTAKTRLISLWGWGHFLQKIT